MVRYFDGFLLFFLQLVKNLSRLIIIFGQSFHFFGKKKNTKFLKILSTVFWRKFFLFLVIFIKKILVIGRGDFYPHPLNPEKFLKNSEGRTLCPRAVAEVRGHGVLPRGIFINLRTGDDDQAENPRPKTRILYIFFFISF